MASGYLALMALCCCIKGVSEPAFAIEDSRLWEAAKIAKKKFENLVIYRFGDLMIWKYKRCQYPEAHYQNLPSLNLQIDSLSNHQIDQFSCLVRISFFIFSQSPSKLWWFSSFHFLLKAFIFSCRSSLLMEKKAVMASESFSKASWL